MPSAVWSAMAPAWAALQSAWIVPSPVRRLFVVDDDEWRLVPSPPPFQSQSAAAASEVQQLYLGEWFQESLEADKLDAILKIQGYNWATRKLLTSMPMRVLFEMDDAGDMVFTSKVPGATTQLRCVDGECVELEMLGTRMEYRVRWGAAGEIMMDLSTHRTGLPTTTATITQRYDAAADRIYSHNSSVEGEYHRILRRLG